MTRPLTSVILVLLACVPALGGDCPLGDEACCPWAVSPAHVEALVEALGPDDASCELTDVNTQGNHTVLRWRADGVEVTGTVLPGACAPESAITGPHFAAVIPTELARLCPAAVERLRLAVTGTTLEVSGGL